MRILHLESPNPGKQGDHVYRTRQPCQALGELPGCEVASGSFLNPAVHDALARADVLVLCDAVDIDLLAVIEARRRAGRLTVYEINDHVLAPQAWSATAYLAENPLLRSLSLQMAARSHALQFSVPELARVFGHLNPRHTVFENQLWTTPPFRARFDDGARTLWLGWGGSLGHREDLLWALPALRAALDRHPRLGLAVMGPEALRPLFDGLPPARFRFQPGGSLEMYYDFLSGLDLGVCPLLPTDFNRCRSDVKFLELASRGVPAICADLPPYAGVVSGETGLRFSDLADLGRQIDRLVATPDLRGRLARAAHASAERRSERAHAPQRLAQYATWQQALGGVFSDEPQGNGYQALASDIETTIREALVDAVAGRRSTALATLQGAERDAPGFYLPALYLGTIDPDPQAGLTALERAQRLAPTAASVALQRGLRLEALGRSDEAAAAYHLCHQLLPSLGAGAAQLGALAERAGNAAEAVAHHEAAVAANPHYTPPVLALAQAALKAGDAARARQILEAGLQHDAKLWRFHFLLGRLEGDSAGRWAAAEGHLKTALTEAPPDQRTSVLAALAKAQLAQGKATAANATLAELRALMTPA
ncbi:MAG TPA: tetratricopeptide repeat protein [Polyangia bacterium]